MVKCEEQVRPLPQTCMWEGENLFMLLFKSPGVIMLFQPHYSENTRNWQFHHSVLAGKQIVVRLRKKPAVWRALVCRREAAAEAFLALSLSVDCNRAPDVSSFKVSCASSRLEIWSTTVKTKWNAPKVEREEGERLDGVAFTLCWRSCCKSQQLLLSCTSVLILDCN